MAIHKLTARKVETARPGKYEDGSGLRLVVSNLGARKWVFRFTFNKKRREMGLGSYPTVSLADARDKAKMYRKQVEKKIDPIDISRAEPEKIPTFTPPVRPVTFAHIGMAGRIKNIAGSG